MERWRSDERRKRALPRLKIRVSLVRFRLRALVTDGGRWS